MTTAEKLRNACLAYWRHRNDAGELALKCARNRLHRIADAYRAGWTLEMVQDVDEEAKGEVRG